MNENHTLNLVVYAFACYGAVCFVLLILLIMAMFCTPTTVEISKTSEEVEPDDDSNHVIFLKMEREILFRGKDKDNNWVEGDLIHGVGDKHGKIFILPIKKNLAYIPNCDPLDGVTVNPETVGQFIGKTDKNETKIFEGFIGVYYNRKGVVVYNIEKSAFCLYSETDDLYVQLDRNVVKEVEIIGNIHDNPELLNTTP